MKKIILALAVLATIGTMTSCKSKEKCPAYGSAAKVHHYKG